MGELGELRNRVEDAVERLAAANDKRKHQSRGLMTLLTDLEAKYEARSEELTHCQKRIEALTRENADLSSLIDRLVGIVDTTVTTGDDDALFRASGMAESLIADWRAAGGDPARHRAEPFDDASVAEAAAEDEPAFPTVEEELAAAVARMEPAADDYEIEVEVIEEPARDAAAEAFAALPPGVGFADVGDEELAGERLDGDPAALAALLDTPLTPEAGAEVAEAFDTPFAARADDFVDMVAMLDAIEAETGETDVNELEPTSLDETDELDPVKEMMAADLDIPEIAIDEDEPVSRSEPDDTEASIRAMMARLEEAAAKARLNVATEPAAEDETAEAPMAAASGAG